ncbi:hypothetical protein HW555_003927 [Spodoptera exigua]|uniref:Uncharacterized protein n=1 Tax=Spodoptera exigua TaxID=7107 RepID=A0A835L8V6_SPOEX|nr:hypothetical protein HW555_003927 [Spodoptera exigua]
MREKLKYHRLFKKYGNPRDNDTFSLLRSRCKKLIAEDYYVFVSSVESSLEHDIKNFWRFVNSKKDTNAIPQTMTYGNLVSSDQRGICELFSRYFGSVFDSSGVTADGETNGIPYKLDPVYLQPGTRDYKVNIPTLPQCVNREIGVTANICDEDVAPSGTIPEFNTLLVYRLGNYQHIGVVSITVYCH